MNPATLSTTSQFFTAAASYYGVPVDQLLLGGQLGRIDGVFAITLQIALTPDDLIGITKRMAQLDKERAGKALDDFLGEPRAGMPLAKSAEFDAEGLTGAWREPNSEGVAGRTVVHADAPEEDGDAGLPAAVWVRYADTTPQLREMASDRCATGSEFLVQVAMLTDEQKMKYGVHADVPEDDNAKLPRAVWMHQDDLAAGQANLVSDRRYIDGSNEYLLQRDMLNDEQKAKYGVAS